MSSSRPQLNDAGEELIQDIRSTLAKLRSLDDLSLLTVEQREDLRSRLIDLVEEELNEDHFTKPVTGEEMQSFGSGTLILSEDGVFWRVGGEYLRIAASFDFLGDMTRSYSWNSSFNVQKHRIELDLRRPPVCDMELDPGDNSPRITFNTELAAEQLRRTLSQFGRLVVSDRDERSYCVEVEYHRRPGYTEFLCCEDKERKTIPDSVRSIFGDALADTAVYHS